MKWFFCHACTRELTIEMEWARVVGVFCFVSDPLHYFEPIDGVSIDGDVDLRFYPLQKCSK